jgi:hypothetical protein
MWRFGERMLRKWTSGRAYWGTLPREKVMLRAVGFLRKDVN